MRDFSKLIPELMARAKMNQVQFAAAIGVTQGTVSRWVKGSIPEPGQQEAIAMFERSKFGGGPDGLSYNVRVDGRVGAGAIIEPDAEQVPPEGLYEIEAPFPVPPGSRAFEIVGDSMRPRYEPGDVIITWHQIADAAEIVGREAIVQTIEGRRYLKRVHSGRRRSTFDLHSQNGLPPIEGVHIEWAAAIGAVIPSGQWLPVKRAGRAHL